VQFEIRHINTTVRPLESATGPARVELDELTRLVAMRLEEAKAEAEGRSLCSDDPAGEQRMRS
jgi:hypothetical protein